jgi:D-alanyl-D-alanine carboxypeptidase (penicillin-binding protein 5/6)
LTNTASADFETSLRTYHFDNFNRLLREYGGANGVKTGFTGKAGHCFVGAAKRGEMQLISVVLASGWGGRGRAMKWTDTKEILDYGFDHYGYETIILMGDLAGDVPVTRSRSASVTQIYGAGLRAPINQAEKQGIQIKIMSPDFIPAPVKQGDMVGKAQILINGALYAEISLIAKQDISRHDLKTSLEKVIGAWLSQGSDAEVRVTLPGA